MKIRKPRAPRRTQLEVDRARAERNEVLARLRQVTRERDAARRTVNALEQSIAHHARDAKMLDVPEVHDERLWSASVRIMDRFRRGRI